MAQDWAADVKKYDKSADDAAIAGIVKHCGIALRKPDSAMVAMSDAKETARVRENFLKKKLGSTASDVELDAAIARVGETMKADRTKNRVTVYYLLAKELGQLGAFAAPSKAPAKTTRAKAPAAESAKTGTAKAAAARSTVAKPAAKKAAAAKTAAKPAAKASTRKTAPSKAKVKTAPAAAAPAPSAAAAPRPAPAAAPAPTPASTPAPTQAMAATTPSAASGGGSMAWLVWVVLGLAALWLVWWLLMR